GNAAQRKAQIVATVEVFIPFSSVVNVDSREPAGAAEHRANAGKAVAGQRCSCYLLAVGTVGSPELLQVHVGDCMVQGKKWMPGVIPRPKAASLLTEKSREHEAAFRGRPHSGQCVCNLDH